MRQPFIAGNWKMYKTAGEAIAVATILATELSGEKNRKIMIAPPFTALHAVRDVLEGSPILLGAQNAASELEGAHTGEISPRMLPDAGVAVIILGHSERRHVYGETDALVNRKVRLALAEGFEVILCVGETLDERQKSVTEKVVETQTRAGLAEVAEKDLARVTIAYEPVWAIGTGRTPLRRMRTRCTRSFGACWPSLYGQKAAQAMTIQYGGSVKPDNIKDLMKMENIDGALVGGASLKPETFLPIVRYDR